MIGIDIGSVLMKKILTTIVVLFLLLTTVNIAASFQISQEEGSLKGKKAEERFDYDQKYAVIIIGTYGSKNQENISGHPREKYYEWYTTSTMRRFNLLTKTYNFDPNNIYVLLTEVEGYVPHDSFNSTKFENYYGSTTENITMVFDELKSIMNEDDFLEVDLIGHGGDEGILRTPIFTKLTGKYIDRNKGINAHDTFMGLENGGKESNSRAVPLSRVRSLFSKKGNMSYSCSDDFKLYDHELASLTFNITARRVLFVLQPCFSGGFINDLSKENQVVITSCMEGEVAGDFLLAFNNGLDGNAEDLNDDGRISLAEVFNYTIAQPEISGFHPLLDDNGDKRGHQDLSYDDGYIAAGIYDLSYEEIGEIPEKANRKNSEFLEDFSSFRTVFSIIFLNRKVN